MDIGTLLLKRMLMVQNVTKNDNIVVTIDLVLLCDCHLSYWYGLVLIAQRVFYLSSLE